MRMVILAVVLSIAQASPPIPRQTANQQAGKSTQSKQSTGTNQQKSNAPATAATLPAPPISDGRSNPASQCNACKPVIVSEPTPMPRKDGWDKAYVIATILLVGIGGFGVCYARRSLLAIESQLKEMAKQRGIMSGQLTEMRSQVSEMGQQTAVLRDSVAAAKASADIAIGVSIPTLVVHEFKTTNLEGAALSAALHFPKIDLVIKNYGQTPALLRSWSLLFTCEELPDVPVYSGQKGCGKVLTKEVVKPGDPYTLTIDSFLYRQELSPDDIQAVIERRKLLIAYGYVCYGDIFGNPLRRLKFCETALNVSDDWIDWRSELAPAAYVGTDNFQAKKAND